ncbi:MAG: phosphate/phosphite/phosphonate ABC transporter substrate-binding protein [Pseudomarimonas sp.]
MQMLPVMPKSARVLMLVMGLGVGGQASADTFTFTVEPSYPPEQAQEVYKPLLDYLARTTGHKFSLNTPRNYHLHWRDIRRGAPFDFVYEEAHFVDYRAQRFGFEPLVKKSNQTVYTLIADEQFADKGLSGLVGRRIVSMPAPSLGFSLLAEMYSNPISQPDFRSEATSWRDGVEMVFAGDAEAAMVPAFIAAEYPNLVPIKESRGLAGAAISAAPTVSTEVKQAVREALLKLHEDNDAYNTLVELGATQFDTTSAAEYFGAEKALSSFFGYVPPSTPAPAAAEPAE